MKLIKALAVVFLMAFLPLTEAGATNSLLRTAQQYSGLSERGNNKQLRRILGVNPARTPWCGKFVTAVVTEAGHKIPHASGLARSWMKYGKRVTVPRPGDIVVIRTKRGYHVGIFSHMKDGKVFLLGGNQSNRVKVSGYALSRIVAMRRA